MTEFGRIIYHDTAVRKFGKILPDAGEPSIWFFTIELADPTGIVTDARVEFDRMQYIQKSAHRVKAINVRLAPKLSIAEPQPINAIRAAKPRLPAPSEAFGKKLVNAEPAQPFVRI
jgi:hypothetical protein